MNKIFILVLLAAGSAGCGTMKNTSSTSAAPVKSAPQATTTPVFIENISIPGERRSERMMETSPNPTKVITANRSSEVELTFPLQFKYSILLDVPVEEIRDPKLFGFIEEWYGTRYRYGGSDKSGIDCSAFVQTFVDEQYGIRLPRTSVDQYINSKRVKKELLQQGDLVFFRTLANKSVSHVGIYLFNNKFLHASTSFGVVISDLSEGYYSDHFAGAGRYRREF
ncbi:MAG TPA: NlpC/P60 family protein [Flavitalea sp.]|nr:NlpC/P60 family protein [Flavitalea sp.]